VQRPGAMNRVNTIIPHSDFGSPDCCGCLVGIVVGERASIVCNECSAVVRLVPATELQKTLDEMEIGLSLATALCPHCRNVNLFPGLSAVTAYVCQSCGRGVELG